MRKLATAAMAFSAAIFISHYLVPPDYYLACAIGCAVLFLSTIFLKSDARTRVLLISLADAVGFLISDISYTYKTVPACEISGTEQSVIARVTDYPEIHDDYTTVNVRLQVTMLRSSVLSQISFEDEFSI